MPEKQQDVRWTVTDRGFKHYAPVTVGGAEVLIYESSRATEPCLWVDRDGSREHLTLAEAAEWRDTLADGPLRDTLTVAIERHYQTPGPDPEDWKAGDPCAMCGSTDTGLNAVVGAFCRDCGATDSDA